MPASTSHPLHEQWASKALKTRTVASGEEAVKSMGETFLPHLSGLNSREY